MQYSHVQIVGEYKKLDGRFVLKDKYNKRQES